jgi:hypothetical protein
MFLKGRNGCFSKQHWILLLETRDFVAGNERFCDGKERFC